MKILCGPDLHIRVKAPEHRTDDFVANQIRKITWILDLAKKEECSLVLFPGDITDHPKLPYWIVRSYIKLFSLYPKIEKVVVRGQHDMLYHVDTMNTPLMLMEAAGVVTIAWEHPIVYEYFTDQPIVNVYGASWDEDIPEPDDSKDISILLIHKMFVLDKLWEGQEDYQRSLIFLRKSKWDLIVSGDNHQRYYSFVKGDRYHVNCGSLMRQNIDQKDHKPGVYIYDTEQRTLTSHDIPIGPIEDVMDLEKAEEEKQERLELQAFVESIERTTEITGLDFVKNWSERLEQDDINTGVKELGQAIMRKAGENL